MNNWKQIINLAWKNVSLKLENDYPCPSERTLVFLIAFEIQKLANNDNLIINFEAQPYDSLIDNISKTKHKFLDLLIFVDDNYKIAIEVKFPKSGNNKGSNSPQTNTRENIYRDLYRLNYLVKGNINNIKEAYFLMSLSEDAYLNEGKYGSHYHTYHNFNLTNYTPDDDEYKLSLKNSFQYFNIKQDKKTKKDGKFAYLEPIKI